MNIYVGVTDYDWLVFLKSKSFPRVNFWCPSGLLAPKTLKRGDIFLFKLHKADGDCICGGGFFEKTFQLSCHSAWDEFGQQNGAQTFLDMKAKLGKYSGKHGVGTEEGYVGCTILERPFFFSNDNCIARPEGWSDGVVRGKTYFPVGKTSTVYSKLYAQVHERLSRVG